MRSVIKDKKDNMHLRHKSAQPGELTEVIEEIEKKKQDLSLNTQNNDDSPYENYEFRNESLEKKSKFVTMKTSDDRSPDFKKKNEGL